MVTTPTDEAPEATTEQHPGGWRGRLRESRLGTVAVLALTTAVVLLGAYVVSGEDPDGEDGVTRVELLGEGSGPPPEVGEPAQDFVATTLDGERIALSDYAGQPVWLLFNATWCSSCRAEAPDVQELHAAHEDLVVLSVYISEDAGTVAEYTNRAGLDYTHVVDPRTTAASAYRVLGIPAHFFIDADGVLRSTAVGSLSPERMATAVEELMSS